MARKKTRANLPASDDSIFYSLPLRHLQRPIEPELQLLPLL